MMYIKSHFSPCLKTIDFVNVVRTDPKVPNKINDMLDRYNRLPYKYQSKKG